MSMKLVFKIHIMQCFVYFIISPEVTGFPGQNMDMNVLNRLTCLRSIL